MAKRDYCILIVGLYCLPSHLDRFIRNLKYNNPDVRVSLLTDRPPHVFPSEMLGSLEELIKWRFSSRLNWIPFVNHWINRCSSWIQMRSLARSRHFDIVNIHYPYFLLSDVMGRFRRMASTIVVTPWGSDVLRVEGKKKKRLLGRVFRRADYITVGPGGYIGRILINEMRVDKKKLHPLAWGSETIDYINEHIQEVSAEDAKRKLGLENRYVITCGYNAFEEQRHEIMIRTILEIKSRLPRELILLFPVTYGATAGTKKDDYVQRLKGMCEDCGLDAVFYENYLSVADLFVLRQATDMFIHIQTTDGGNTSLQEYVLLGKKVVHGTWIHYKTLEQYEPLFYYPVDDLDQLGEAILIAYHSEPINTPAEVLDHIRNRGWKAKMELWNNFFVSIA